MGDGLPLLAGILGLMSRMRRELFYRRRKGHFRLLCIGVLIEVSSDFCIVLFNSCSYSYVNVGFVHVFVTIYVYACIYVLSIYNIEFE